MSDYAGLIRDLDSARDSDSPEFTRVILVRAETAEQAHQQLQAIAEGHPNHQLEFHHNGIPVYEVVDRRTTPPSILPDTLRT